MSLPSLIAGEIVPAKDAPTAAAADVEHAVAGVAPFASLPFLLGDIHRMRSVVQPWSSTGKSWVMGVHDVPQVDAASSRVVSW